jgi:Protein of unknown function (DUF1800)
MSLVRQALDNMGHAPFAWETPDGYPDTMEFWSGLVLARWNAAGTIVAQTGASFAVSVTPFIGASPEAGAELIVEKLLGGEAPLSYTARLADYLRPAHTNTTRVREAISLALSSSQFQWY